MADFGADLAGVRRLLPSLVIPAEDSTEVPDEGDVTAWLAEFTGEVARRLGDFSTLDPAQVNELNAAARRLVHWAVAATVYDAHFPERAALTDESYGAVLWDRYTAGLDELDTEVAELLGGADAEAVAGGTPLYSFPEPAFPDNLVL